jgi:hypothetical protein
VRQEGELGELEVSVGREYTSEVMQPMVKTALVPRLRHRLGLTQD